MKIAFSLLALSLHLPAVIVLSDTGFSKGAEISTSVNEKHVGPIMSVSLQRLARSENSHFNHTEHKDLAITKTHFQSRTSYQDNVQEELPVVLHGPMDVQQGHQASLNTDFVLTTAPVGENELLHRTFPYYVPASQLTTLPHPIEEIDLEQLLKSEAAIAGTIDLTILIEENGWVADVIALTQSDNLQDFSDRVKERFKSARFTPGEINGQAVRSSIQVTVVSEALIAQGH